MTRDAFGSRLVVPILACAALLGCGESKSSSHHAGSGGTSTAGGSGGTNEPGAATSGTTGGSVGASGESSADGGTAHMSGGASSAGTFNGGSTGAGSTGKAGDGAAAGTGSGGASSAGVAGSGASSGAGSSGAGMSSAGAGGGFAHTRSDRVVYVAGADEVRAYDFDRLTGEFTAQDDVPYLGPKPSSLALSPERTVLIVANDDDSERGGLTTASIDAAGHLTYFDHEAGTDGGFTFVAINGREAVAASYGGGSISSFPLNEDGTLLPEESRYDFEDGAKTQFVGFDAYQSGPWMLATNHGTDEIAQLVFSSNPGIQPNSPPSVITPTGSGPRHVAVHANVEWAFAINELNSTLTAYHYSGTGTLIPENTISTLPAGFDGPNTGTDVGIAPNGDFVYASNQGHDSIVAFAFDQATGELTPLEHQPSGGQSPRDFDIDIKGNFMIVANRDDAKVVALAIELDGTLTPLGSVDGPEGAQSVQIRYQP